MQPATTQVDDLLGQIRERVEVKERVLVTTLTKRMAEDLTDFVLLGCVYVTCTRTSIPLSV